MTNHAQKFRGFLGTPVQLAVIALLAGAAPVHAQTAETAEANKLPVVVVTATKKETSLQKTPVAVTALSAETLENNHVQTLLDVFNLVPSMQGTGQGDHGIVSITLRGIGNDSAKTEYADPEVALFIDGVFSPRPEGASTLLFDLDGLEVLRGPQGTLWGRNSTVGAVNLKTAKPKLKDQSGYFEGGIGSYARVGTRGAVNVPVSDTFALRFAFVHEQHDGYVDYQRSPQLSLASQQAAYNAAFPTGGPGFQALNPNLFVQGGPKYNAQDQSAARLSMLWKPSKEFSWDLSLEQFRDRGTPSMSLMQTPRAGEKHWSALIDTAPSLERDSTAVRSRMVYDMSGMSLTYVAGIGRFKGSGTYDQDLGVQIPTSFTTGANHQEDNTVWSKYNSYSHEMTLQSTGKQSLDWILGLYYAAEDNGIRFDIPIMNGTQQGTVGWQGSFIQPKETVASKAVFGQVNFNLSDALHLTAGARYTQDDRKNIGGGSWTWAYNPLAPQVPLDPGLDPKTSAGYQRGDVNDAHYTGSKATYLARAAYDLSKDAMLYASVSTGYKSGGTGDGGFPYGPETLVNYELGLKSTLMDGRMTFNLTGYYMDFTDFQFSAPVIDAAGNRSFKYSNAEGAKVGGLELEMAMMLSDNDRLQVAASYIKTKLGALVAATNDYQLPPCSVPGLGGNCMVVTGNELPHAPKFSLQLQYDHTFRFSGGDTLAPRISYHYQTANWLSVFNMGAGDQQKAYSTADIGLRYDAKKNWYADLYVRNVSDAKVKTSAGSAGSFANPIWTAQYIAPRTVGLNAGYNF